MLVNCLMGMSRSSTCVLAYLMLRQNMTAVQALTEVRRHRDVRPNDGFLRQLADLDNKLRRERGQLAAATESVASSSSATSSSTTAGAKYWLESSFPERRKKSVNSENQLILQISLPKTKGTNNEKKITITNDNYWLSHKETQKMIDDAKKYAEENKLVRERTETKSSLES